MWLLLLVLIDGIQVGITPSVKFKTEKLCLKELAWYLALNEEHAEKPIYRSMECKFSKDHK